MRENGIPRSNMPQIDQEYMGAFQQTLTDRGITFDSEKVSPLKLTPTQSELDGRSTGKLVKAMENGEMDWSNAIWVSEEGNILDGHHRWAAAAAIAADGGMNVEIPIIRVHTPIGNLLSVAYEFDEAAAVKTRGFGESWWADDRAALDSAKTWRIRAASLGKRRTYSSAVGVSPAARRRSTSMCSRLRSRVGWASSATWAR